jgi:hypothetical protein
VPKTLFRTVLQTWDCHNRILILQTIEYQYARSQRQLRGVDRPNILSANYFALHLSQGAAIGPEYAATAW